MPDEKDIQPAKAEIGNVAVLLGGSREESEGVAREAARHADQRQAARAGWAGHAGCHAEMLPQLSRWTFSVPAGSARAFHASRQALRAGSATVRVSAALPLRPTGGPCPCSSRSG